MNKMRVAAHLLAFVVIGVALLIGLGLSRSENAMWGDILWLAAAVAGMVNLVWIVRYMMKH